MSHALCYDMRSVSTHCSCGTPRLQHRRAVLRLALLPLLPSRVLRSRDAHAAEVVQESPLGVGQPVRPALPARAYVAEIRKVREETLASLRGYVEVGDFRALSDSLVLSPFDDLRQSCFYLPWAVVATDEAAGTALETAWQELRQRWIQLDSVSLAAARFEREDSDVNAAIDAFQRSLDAYENTIPASLK